VSGSKEKHVKNKGMIISIVVGVLLITFVVLGVQYSKKSDNQASTTKGAARVCTTKGNVYTADDDKNPAGNVGKNETRLTCETFKDNVDNAKGIVMVDMYLAGCPHCQKMGPVVAEIADQTVGKYKIAKIDVGKYPEIGTEFNIESVPAFIIFKDGKEVKRLIGEQTKQQLMDALSAANK
jgi:thioredoxin 1